MDVIFSSGNGVAEVDRLWFERALPGRVLGVPVLLAPVEEIIWSKSYVQERERYDGADIHHLLRHRGDRIDWRFLMKRMAPHAEVLLAHLLLFRFCFPDDRQKVPGWVLEELVARALGPVEPGRAGVCRGTLLSTAQYLPDLAEGLRDARALEAPHWTEYRGRGS